MTSNPTETEKDLIKEVDAMAEEPFEGYIEGWRFVRSLGNVMLKVVSKIESDCDELIISWNEKVKHPYSLSSSAFQIFQKYRPLLSKMYFINKVDALKDYGLLKNGKGLHHKLGWLNDRRNKFAHYGVYRYDLQSEYEISGKRVEALLELKRIIRDFEDFRKDVKELLTDPKVIGVIKIKYW